MHDVFLYIYKRMLHTASPRCLGFHFLTWQFAFAVLVVAWAGSGGWGEGYGSETFKLSRLSLTRLLSGSYKAAVMNIYSCTKGFTTSCKWSTVGPVLSSSEGSKDRGWTLRHVKQRRRCRAVGNRGRLFDPQGRGSSVG